MATVASIPLELARSPSPVASSDTFSSPPPSSSDSMDCLQKLSLPTSSVQDSVNLPTPPATLVGSDEEYEAEEEDDEQVEMQQAQCSSSSSSSSSSPSPSSLVEVSAMPTATTATATSVANEASITLASTISVPIATSTATPTISEAISSSATPLSTSSSSTTTSLSSSSSILSVSTPTEVPAAAAAAATATTATVTRPIQGATTYFDDMVNHPEPPANILTLSPTTSIPDLYHDFFDNHPELGESDQSSDPEMDLDMDSPRIRARTLAAWRPAAVAAAVSHGQAPLIADRPVKLETIDTINLFMIHHPTNNGARLNFTNTNNKGFHHLASGNNMNGSGNTNNGQHMSGQQQQQQGNGQYNNNNNGHHHNHNHNNDGSDDSNSQNQDEHNKNQTPQRRKKASRACFHCQKAHLTCDDSRPCQRCIKRDLAGTCADGVRKKAKYLQDAYDSQQAAAAAGNNNNSNNNNNSSNNNNTNGSPSAADHHQRQSSIASTLSMSESPLQGHLSGDGIQNGPLSDGCSGGNNGNNADDGSMVDPNFFFPMSADYGFGSEAVNLEYSIISNMLSSPTAEMSPMTDLSMVDNWSRQDGSNNNSGHGNGNQHQNGIRNQHMNGNSLIKNNNVNGSFSNGSNNSNGINNNNNNANNNAVAPTSSTGSNFHPTGSARASKRKFPSNTPENVYANTKQPFNYTDGFHYLLKYVRERMDKEEMMRICRAMAMFRPSFIALIMNLTPEDLIFMEKCFQRTVLEFEKLISFSGTPTVVWRRTGEIALVGKEFSLLTQWGRDQLVGKKTYIYELMDNQSAVEYWERFSTHAFENTEQTVMTTCILLSPTNRVVPCTFCFTIKRDIFDIPLAIVGNFLPILS